MVIQYNSVKDILERPKAVCYHTTKYGNPYSSPVLFDIYYPVVGVTDRLKILLEKVINED